MEFAEASSSASMQVSAMADRFWRFMKDQNSINNPLVYMELCRSLARGIDHAIANNGAPSVACDLPSLLRKVHKCQSYKSFQAEFMVLMFSVKNACMNRWFTDKDAEDLLLLAKEVKGVFSSEGDINVEPSYALTFVSTVMSRFYPHMKMDKILVSVQAKPGFHAYLVDFQLSRNVVDIQKEKIKLFIARTDIMDTSSCIISPPEVSFLLNGGGVPGRANISMNNGPQLPTNVTAILKYGTNLLQAIGTFDGPYIIVIATMSRLPSLSTTVLQDYDQPVSASFDSDSDIAKSSSGVSLNCPISQRRIRVPVKGRLCKHLQCFDYDYYLTTNLRQPSWQCPFCKLSLCHLDLRIDQNIAKVLREVGEDVVRVVFFKNGSWMPVLEKNGPSSQQHTQSGVNPESSSTITNDIKQEPQTWKPVPEKNDRSSVGPSGLGLTSSNVQTVNVIPENLHPTSTPLSQNGLAYPSNMQFHQPSVRSSNATVDDQVVGFDGQSQTAANRPLDQDHLQSLAQMTKNIETFTSLFGSSFHRSGTVSSTGPNMGEYDTLHWGNQRRELPPGLHVIMSQASFQQHQPLSQNQHVSDQADQSRIPNHPFQALAGSSYISRPPTLQQQMAQHNSNAMRMNRAMNPLQDMVTSPSPLPGRQFQLRGNLQWQQWLSQASNPSSYPVNSPVPAQTTPAQQRGSLPQPTGMNTATNRPKNPSQNPSLLQPTGMNTAANRPQNPSQNPSLLQPTGMNTATNRPQNPSQNPSLLQPTGMNIATNRPQNPSQNPSLLQPTGMNTATNRPQNPSQNPSFLQPTGMNTAMNQPQDPSLLQPTGMNTATNPPQNPSPPAIPRQQGYASPVPGQQAQGERGDNTQVPASGAYPAGLSQVSGTSDPNWRPSKRMRGSLTGEAYSAALSQFMRPPPIPSVVRSPRIPSPPGFLPHLAVVSPLSAGYSSSKDQKPPNPSPNPNL